VSRQFDTPSRDPFYGSIARTSYRTDTQHNSIIKSKLILSISNPNPWN
jgi:hypothetical protein